MTTWALEWHSHNRVDGETRHVIFGGQMPVLFRTRQAARCYARLHHDYSKEARPDLRAEPHGWRVPRPVRVRVLLEEKR